jgi:transcription antitermination factor NusG
MSEEIVTVIRERTAGLSQRVRCLQPGDAVAVVRGPLADLEGVFCESLSGEERVVILLDVMRRQTRVALPKRDIVPVVSGAGAWYARLGSGRIRV